MSIKLEPNKTYSLKFLPNQVIDPDEGDNLTYSLTYQNGSQLSSSVNFNDKKLELTFPIDDKSLIGNYSYRLICKDDFDASV